MALLFVSLTGCATVGRHEAGIDNFDKVSPTLYRGAQPSQKGIQTLADMHVRTVINLRDSDDTQEAGWVKAAGMNYVRLPLDAETVTPADAEKFLDLLSKAEKPVFVHCHVGRDRTGMAVAAYRVCMEDWKLEDAVKELYAHGHFWVLFPKVRGAVAELAHNKQVLAADVSRAITRADVPATPVAAGTPAVTAAVGNSHLAAEMIK